MRGDQNDQESNFIQLLKLCGTDNPNIIKHLGQKLTYTPAIKFKMKYMGLNVLSKIKDDFYTFTHFSLITDEVTDAFNGEQVVICLCRVDNSFEPNKEFIGLYKVDETSVNTITDVLSDVLQRMNLSMSNCHGQYYDGASNISWIRQGTAAQFLLQELHALYNHCYDHALNLAVRDTIKQI